MLPDLESLRCFEAAADETSFRLAAERVHLSPAAFGERIKRLEDQLGARLFERTTRRIALTTPGQRLVEPARRLLDEARRLEKIAREQGPRPFELSVGTRFELGISWLVPSLTMLSGARPERRIDLVFGDSDLLHRLKTGGIDCLVSSVRLTESGLQYAALHQERYLLVGATRRLRQRPLRSPEDARRHVLIDATRDLPLFRYFLDACPPKQVWAFGGTEFLGTIAAIRARVLEGAGIAVLPAYFVRPDLAARRLVRLMPKVEPSHDYFRLIWRQDHPEAEELQKLADELRTRPLK